jgi:hypothetical protein
MSDSTDRKNDHLDNTIEKLETIIDDKEEQIYTGSIPVLKESMVPNQAQESVPTAAIPVLDELVKTKPEDVTQSISTGHPGYTPAQLMQLVDKLENKLNGELEMLINVIKGNMKETIVEEIRSQMDIFPLQKDQKSDQGETDVNDEDEDPSLHQDGYRPYGEGDDI